MMFNKLDELAREPEPQQPEPQTDCPCNCSEPAPNDGDKAPAGNKSLVYTGEYWDIHG
jgi:hypothetical protein